MCVCVCVGGVRVCVSKQTIAATTRRLGSGPNQRFLPMEAAQHAEGRPLVGIAQPAVW